MRGLIKNRSILNRLNLSTIVEAVDNESYVSYAFHVLDSFKGVHFVIYSGSTENRNKTGFLFIDLMHFSVFEGIDAVDYLFKFSGLTSNYYT
jgi:hypothetical protein